MFPKILELNINQRENGGRCRTQRISIDVLIQREESDFKSEEWRVKSEEWRMKNGEWKMKDKEETTNGVNRQRFWSSWAVWELLIKMKISWSEHLKKQGLWSPGKFHSSYILALMWLWIQMMEMFRRRSQSSTTGFELQLKEIVSMIPPLIKQTHFSWSANPLTPPAPYPVGLF